MQDLHSAAPRALQLTTLLDVFVALTPQKLECERTMLPCSCTTIVPVGTMSNPLRLIKAMVVIEVDHVDTP